MKNNAIVRIISWSILLVVLAGILLGGLLLKGGFWDIPYASSGEQSEAAVPITEAVMGVSDGSDITLDASQITGIEIEWVSGSILIESADVEAIEISESGVSDDRYAMVWKQKGSKLRIEFCEENLLNSFRASTGLSKDLVISVPRSWECGALEVDAASAALEVYGLTVQEVEVDTASGTCDFENCAVDEMDLDTASGDISFTGTLNVLDCEATSASFTGILYNTPSRMEMDSMSGDLDITLPEDAGFTASIDAMSSNFVSDFETILQNGKHVCGDGSCRINVSAMSGDVVICKGSTSAPETAAAEPTHEHTEECTTHPDSCPLTSSTEHHGGEHE